MRKLFVLFLCLIFSTSAFAKMSVDAVLKLGAAPSSQINNNHGERLEADPGYSISPEAYFYFTDNLGIGLGFNQMFNRYIERRGTLSTSNFYFAFRPKLKVIQREYVYLLGQIGYGFMNHTFSVNGEELDDTGGLYYGLGGGVDIYNFIFELLFTSNKAMFKSVDSNYQEENDYTMMTINIGYRFSMPIAKKEKSERKMEDSEPQTSYYEEEMTLPEYPAEEPEEE